MAKYLEKAHVDLAKFKDFVIRQIPRSENSNADALAQLTSAYETELPHTVIVEVLAAPSISEVDLCDVTIRVRWWKDPIIDFL